MNLWSVRACMSESRGYICSYVKAKECCQRQMIKREEEVRLGDHDEALRLFQGLVWGWPGSERTISGPYSLNWLWWIRSGLGEGDRSKTKICADWRGMDAGRWSHWGKEPAMEFDIARAEGPCPKILFEGPATEATWTPAEAELKLGSRGWGVERRELRLPVAAESLGFCSLAATS